MNTALVIMAAGIGSRFGTGIKQLQPIGHHDELIIDYSIHDAIFAGINKIIFVIRKEIEAEFRNRIGNRVVNICAQKKVEVLYTYQTIMDVPISNGIPYGRTKPWGTCHAVLAAGHLLHEPFMVINADDYYGKEAFIKMHEWLTSPHEDTQVAMMGYILKNTLSDNGGVTRAICRLDSSRSHVIDIIETKGIEKANEDARVGDQTITAETIVSMNMWGFSAKNGQTPFIIEQLRRGFEEFLMTEVPKEPLEKEFLLPVYLRHLVKNKLCTIDVLVTEDRWFGVTYKEDIPFVINSLRKLIENGVYQDDLFSDLNCH